MAKRFISVAFFSRHFIANLSPGVLKSGSYLMQIRPTDLPDYFFGPPCMRTYNFNSIAYQVEGNNVYSWLYSLNTSLRLLLLRVHCKHIVTSSSFTVC